jgi:hypothetical protein
MLTFKIQSLLIARLSLEGEEYLAKWMDLLRRGIQDEADSW